MDEAEDFGAALYNLLFSVGTESSSSSSRPQTRFFQTSTATTSEAQSVPVVMWYIGVIAVVFLPIIVFLLKALRQSQQSRRKTCPPSLGAVYSDNTNDGLSQKSPDGMTKTPADSYTKPVVYSQFNFGKESPHIEQKHQEHFQECKRRFLYSLMSPAKQEKGVRKERTQRTQHMQSVQDEVLTTEHDYNTPLLDTEKRDAPQGVTEPDTEFLNQFTSNDPLDEPCQQQTPIIDDKLFQDMQTAGCIYQSSSKQSSPKKRPNRRHSSKSPVKKKKAKKRNQRSIFSKSKHIITCDAENTINEAEGMPNCEMSCKKTRGKRCSNDLGTKSMYQLSVQGQETIKTVNKRVKKQQNKTALINTEVATMELQNLMYEVSLDERIPKPMTPHLSKPFTDIEPLVEEEMVDLELRCNSHSCFPKELRPKRSRANLCLVVTSEKRSKGKGRRSTPNNPSVSSRNSLQFDKKAVSMGILKKIVSDHWDDAIDGGKGTSSKNTPNRQKVKRKNKVKVKVAPKIDEKHIIEQAAPVKTESSESQRHHDSSISACRFKKTKRKAKTKRMTNTLQETRAKEVHIGASTESHSVNKSIDNTPDCPPASRALLKSRKRFNGSCETAQENDATPAQDYKHSMASSNTAPNNMRNGTRSKESSGLKCLSGKRTASQKLHKAPRCYVENERKRELKNALICPKKPNKKTENSNDEYSCLGCIRSPVLKTSSKSKEKKAEIEDKESQQLSRQKVKEVVQPIEGYILNSKTPIENTLLLCGSAITTTYENWAAEQVKGTGTVKACSKDKCSDQFPSLSSYLDHLEKKATKKSDTRQSCRNDRSLCNKAKDATRLSPVIGNSKRLKVSFKDTSTGLKQSPTRQPKGEKHNLSINTKDVCPKRLQHTNGDSQMRQTNEIAHSNVKITSKWLKKSPPKTKNRGEDMPQETTQYNKEDNIGENIKCTKPHLPRANDANVLNKNKVSGVVKTNPGKRYSYLPLKRRCLSKSISGVTKTNETHSLAEKKENSLNTLYSKKTIINSKFTHSPHTKPKQQRLSRFSRKDENVSTLNDKAPASCDQSKSINYVPHFGIHKPMSTDHQIFLQSPLSRWSSPQQVDEISIVSPKQSLQNDAYATSYCSPEQKRAAQASLGTIKSADETSSIDLQSMVEMAKAILKQRKENKKNQMNVGSHLREETPKLEPDRSAAPMSKTSPLKISSYDHILEDTTTEVKQVISKIDPSYTQLYKATSSHRIRPWKTTKTFTNRLKLILQKNKEENSKRRITKKPKAKATPQPYDVQNAVTLNAPLDKIKDANHVLQSTCVTLNQDSEHRKEKEENTKTYRVENSAKETAHLTTKLSIKQPVSGPPKLRTEALAQKRRRNNETHQTEPVKQKSSFGTKKKKQKSKTNCLKLTAKHLQHDLEADGEILIGTTPSFGLGDLKLSPERTHGACTPSLLEDLFGKSALSLGQDPAQVARNHMDVLCYESHPDGTFSGAASRAEKVETELSQLLNKLQFRGDKNIPFWERIKIPNQEISMAGQSNTINRFPLLDSNVEKSNEGFTVGERMSPKSILSPSSRRGFLNQTITPELQAISEKDNENHDNSRVSETLFINSEPDPEHSIQMQHPCSRFHSMPNLCGQLSLSTNEKCEADVEIANLWKKDANKNIPFWLKTSNTSEENAKSQPSMFETWDLNRDKTSPDQKIEEFIENVDLKSTQSELLSLHEDRCISDAGITLPKSGDDNAGRKEKENNSIRVKIKVITVPHNSLEDVSPTKRVETEELPTEEYKEIDERKSMITKEEEPNHIKQNAIYDYNPQENNESKRQAVGHIPPADPSRANSTNVCPNVKPSRNACTTSNTFDMDTSGVSPDLCIRNNENFATKNVMTTTPYSVTSSLSLTETGEHEIVKFSESMCDIGEQSPKKSPDISYPTNLDKAKSSTSGYGTADGSSSSAFSSSKSKLFTRNTDPFSDLLLEWSHKEEKYLKPKKYRDTKIPRAMKTKTTCTAQSCQTYEQVGARKVLSHITEESDHSEPCNTCEKDRWNFSMYPNRKRDAQNDRRKNYPISSDSVHTVLRCSPKSGDTQIVTPTPNNTLPVTNYFSTVYHDGKQAELREVEQRTNNRNNKLGGLQHRLELDPKLGPQNTTPVEHLTDMTCHIDTHTKDHSHDIANSDRLCNHTSVENSKTKINYHVRGVPVTVIYTSSDGVDPCLNNEDEISLDSWTRGSTVHGKTSSKSIELQEISDDKCDSENIAESTLHHSGEPKSENSSENTLKASSIDAINVTGAENKDFTSIVPSKSNSKCEECDQVFRAKCTKNLDTSKDNQSKMCEKDKPDLESLLDSALHADSIPASNLLFSRAGTRRTRDRRINRRASSTGCIPSSNTHDTIKTKKFDDCTPVCQTAQVFDKRNILTAKRSASSDCSKLNQFLNRDAPAVTCDNTRQTCRKPWSDTVSMSVYPEHEEGSSEERTLRDILKDVPNSSFGPLSNKRPRIESKASSKSYIDGPPTSSTLRKTHSNVAIEESSNTSTRERSSEEDKKCLTHFERIGDTFVKSKPTPNDADRAMHSGDGDSSDNSFCQVPNERIQIKRRAFKPRLTGKHSEFKPAPCNSRRGLAEMEDITIQNFSNELHNTHLPGISSFKRDTRVSHSGPYETNSTPNEKQIRIEDNKKEPNANTLCLTGSGTTSQPHSSCKPNQETHNKYRAETIGNIKDCDIARQPTGLNAQTTPGDSNVLKVPGNRNGEFQALIPKAEKQGRNLSPCASSSSSIVLSWIGSQGESEPDGDLYSIVVSECTNNTIRDDDENVNLFGYREDLSENGLLSTSPSRNVDHTHSSQKRSKHGQAANVSPRHSLSLTMKNNIGRGLSDSASSLWTKSDLRKSIKNSNENNPTWGLKNSFTPHIPYKEQLRSNYFTDFNCFNDYEMCTDTFSSKLDYSQDEDCLDVSESMDTNHNDEGFLEQQSYLHKLKKSLAWDNDVPSVSWGDTGKGQPSAKSKTVTSEQRSTKGGYVISAWTNQKLLHSSTPSRTRLASSVGSQSRQNAAASKASNKGSSISVREPGRWSSQLIRQSSFVNPKSEHNTRSQSNFHQLTGSGNKIERRRPARSLEEHLRMRSQTNSRDINRPGETDCRSDRIERRKTYKSLNEHLKATTEVSWRLTGIGAPMQRDAERNEGQETSGCKSPSSQSRLNWYRPQSLSSSNSLCTNHAAGAQPDLDGSFIQQPRRFSPDTQLEDTNETRANPSMTQAQDGKNDINKTTTTTTANTIETNCATTTSMTSKAFTKTEEQMSRLQKESSNTLSTSQTKENKKVSKIVEMFEMKRSTGQ